jgi:hypothetical protein
MDVTFVQDALRDFRKKLWDAQQERVRWGWSPLLPCWHMSWDSRRQLLSVCLSTTGPSENLMVSVKAVLSLW